MPDENKNKAVEFDIDFLRSIATAAENLKTASAALTASETLVDEVDPDGPLIEQFADEVEKEDEDEATMQRLDSSSLNLQIAELTKCVETLRTNLEGVQADTNRKNAETDGLLTDNKLREMMADKTYHFMSLWCMFVAMIIALYVIKKEFEPPETVIIALMGTTTVSIVGLVGFVVSGLFKSNVKSSGGEKSE
ncbi:TPA: DUF2975 domain-containing protein [Salmonella enterica]